MSEELIASIQEKLKEETWTRATISEYTENSLKDLDKYVDQSFSDNCSEDVKKICEEHLDSNKNSIIALYISGMIGLKSGDLDHSSMEALVDIFQKNHKEPIVKYLCVEKILCHDPQNKFALHTMAVYYRENKEEALMWETYETIVKIDPEEFEIARVLADHYEHCAEEKRMTDPQEFLRGMEKAVSYYKKSILRGVASIAPNTGTITDVWKKLVDLIPEQIDFFYMVQRKIAKAISETISATLMQDIYKKYKDQKKWNTCIDILKLILNIDARDSFARQEITECFRNKYISEYQEGIKEEPAKQKMYELKIKHLDKHLKNSGLDGDIRNVFESIADFEKHVAYDVGNFVSHRTWGIGGIVKVKDDKLLINFGAKNGIQEMSIKMAENALVPLDKNHIWVKKATMQREALAKKVKDDKVWALKTIIKSFGNSCDFKKIKEELCDSVLTKSEWTAWNNAAKKIIETDSAFGVDPNDSKKFVVRDHEITLEEKLSLEFKAHKKFFDRIATLLKYLDAEDTDKESEIFFEMIKYFTDHLKTVTIANEEVVASFLAVKQIEKEYPDLPAVKGVTVTFEEIYRKIESQNKLDSNSPDARAMYIALKQDKSKRLQESFLEHVKMLSDWSDQYILLFPTVLDKNMLIRLVDSGFTDKVQKLVKNAFENYRDFRDTVIFFFEKCQEDEWYKTADISYEKQMVTLINIISLGYREISIHTNTPENKKICKSAEDLLFTDGTLINYALEQDESVTKKLYTLVNDVEGLGPDIKQRIRVKILDKYPNFDFGHSEDAEKSAAPDGFMVTSQMLEAKKIEADDIQTNQLPAVAAEVSEAREKGDLKENAEYIAAKEHQHILNEKLKKLREQIDKAVVFDPTTLNTTVISFGTHAVLHNNITGKDEEVTILGAWESNPDEGIISYRSPLGNKLLDAKVGQELKFDINRQEYDYKVLSITAAKF
jgi:transcription elongation factor GreA